MASPEFTPLPVTNQQLVVQIQIGDGASARIVQIPVADTAEGLRVQQRIIKHPGKLMFGEDTNAPMTINCGRVVLMTMALVDNQPQAQQPAPPKIATLRQ